MRLNAAKIQELAAKRTTEQNAALVRATGEVPFNDLVDPNTGEKIDLPEDCGEGMDKFLDDLSAKWHAARG